MNSVQQGPFSYLFNGNAPVSTQQNSNSTISDTIEGGHVARMKQYFEQLQSELHQNLVTDFDETSETSSTMQQVESPEQTAVYNEVASTFSMSREELLQIIQSKNLQKRVNELLNKLLD
ncbi:MAG: hypothetical protein HWD61_07355 [Parachlamydiaceae bacterium]|nr:MAG: hypothetical protein HWD61_07355 [Parachlamydiaceae bacterium]